MGIWKIPSQVVLCPKAPIYPLDLPNGQACTQSRPNAPDQQKGQSIAVETRQSILILSFIGSKKYNI